MEYQNIINELSADKETYHAWFRSATDTQKSMIWEAVWNQAALTHSDNKFVQDLYDFYQIGGYLTYKQWCYLIRAIQPNILKAHSLKDRLK